MKLEKINRSEHDANDFMSTHKPVLNSRQRIKGLEKSISDRRVQTKRKERRESFKRIIKGLFVVVLVVSVVIKFVI
ncbi:MAG: hypothetical protein GY928_06480 [Colwellia sp.]|nr:hypothetical protein [Colwellia sp.]